MAQSNRPANCQPQTVSANPVSSPQSPLPASLWLGKLTFFFYVLLTLFPPSEGIWGGGLRAFLWQVGLLCPVLWLLGILLRQRQMPRLGGGWDAIALFAILMAIVSTVFAESPNKALECAIAAAGYLAVVYALKHDLQTPQQRHGLLICQGYVNLGFIACSLGGWAIYAGIPAWRRWQEVRGLAGEVEVSIAPNEIPLGTPGAIAAYLVLALPLLAGLAIADRGWRRGLWLAGSGLGLLDLYTTNSALGWLGLGVLG
ncbi:MAG: O-antigen ligase domain-containing protein, partial [Cyanobacteria bacterium J055]